jgi:Cu+-exporting ATPase
MLTGESLPVDKARVTSSSAPRSTPPARCSCAPPPSGTTPALAQIVRLVEDAQGSKVPMQRLADKVSSVFVPAVIVTALLTALAWAAVGPDGESMTMAVTTSIAVLIIACPCALGLRRRPPSWSAPAAPPSSAS